MSRSPRDLTPEHENSFDRTVEWLGRWTAAATTRRSFLHRLGQFAVLIAAGPTLANLLIRKVEARVCGQTGVTPKCDTFDCVGDGTVWGWCWYASDGCCRNNGLKKICDCCIVNYPNVHGYCPAGTNVACIVESCGEDPRVLNVDIAPVEPGTDRYFASAIETAHGGGALRAVLADRADPWDLLLGAPLAGTLGVPLVESNGGIPFAAVNQLLNLGVRTVMAVGRPSNAATTTLTNNGITIEIVTDAADLTQRSVDVAERIRSINTINRTVTVDAAAQASIASLAANFGAVSGFPLVVGADAAEAVGAPTVTVGNSLKPDVPRETTRATTREGLAVELAQLAAVAPGARTGRVTVAPNSVGSLTGLLNLQTSIVFHAPGQLGPVAEWLENMGKRHGRYSQVFFVQGPGQLTTPEYWRLQGTVNGFRVNELMGVPGQGLPVFRQPLHERVIGNARVDGALEWGSVEAPNYWTGVAQTYRGD